MADNEWISPSKEANEALQQRILEAIFPIVLPMKEDEEYDKSVPRIISALRKGKEIEKEADKEFKAENPGKNVHGHYPLIMEAIATCIAALAAGDTDIEGRPANSLCGSHVMAYAMAVNLLDSASRAEAALDFDINDFGLNIAEKLLTATA